MSVIWINTNRVDIQDDIPESAKKLTNWVLLSLKKALDMSDAQLIEIEKNSNSTREAIFSALKEKKLLNDPKVAVKLFWIDAFEYYSLFNKSVFNNKNVLSTALNNDIDIFKISSFALPIRTLLMNDFQANKSLADIILKSYVKSNKNISDIEVFISQIAWDNSEITEQLKKMYEKYLKAAHKLHSNDVKNQALLLSTSKNKDLYKLFTDKDIINKSWEIDNKTSKLWSKEVSDAIKNSTTKNTKESIIEFLLSKIGLKTKDLKIAEITSLIEAIFNVLQIQKLSADAQIEIDNYDEKWEDNTGKVWKENTWLEKDDSDKFDYCLNNESCSFAYSLSWEWNYIINTGYNNITISKNEYKSFSPNSLENFIKLNALLYQCGLSFILENKYKNWFFQLMQNRHVWFSAQWGQWFSHFFQLDALNVIANLIWVPKNLYWKDSSVWRFSDKQTAKQAFQSIHSSWNINNENITKAWGGFLDHSATQVKLQKMWILWENWWFEVKRAEEVLKEWGYTNEESTENREINNVINIDFANSNKNTHNINNNGNLNEEIKLTA